MSLAPALRAEIVEALSRWELAGEAERLGGGAANEHWRIAVEGEERPWVLRRYHPRHVATDIAYEHRVLAYLEARDWPVAPPLADARGRTLAETDAGLWALFRWRGGEPAPPESPLYLQRKGALLALLHSDLAEAPDFGQRPGFGRADDLDACVRADGHESVEALLDWYAGRDEARATSLADALTRNREALATGGFAELPDQLIYYECLGGNVRFREDTVTALFDFDLTHRDARVADIARSLAVDCGVSAKRAGAWLAGYANLAQPRLNEDEAALIAPLITAAELWNTVLPLSIGARWGNEAQIRAAETSIDRRLALSEEGERVLAAVAQQAARS